MEKLAVTFKELLQASQYPIGDLFLACHSKRLNMTLAGIPAGLAHLSLATLDAHQSV
jgi:hypothetical protein